MDMYALQYAQYGGPEVLQLNQDVPEPHAGPGQVRVAVHATSVNPYDWKLRAGYLDGMVPVSFPAIPGLDAAGIVDEIGEGVEGVAVGDRVAGLGSATAAEYAVLEAFTPVPDSITWAQAGTLGLSVETAARVLDELGVGEGTTLLIEGGSGGVGTAAIQLARKRGARVIATASEQNQDYLRSLGAEAIPYGAGLSERVRGLAPEGVDAVLDCAGSGSLTELIALAPEPNQVVTTADFTATSQGARVSGYGERAWYALADVARLVDAGEYHVELSEIFPLERAAEAHAASQSGHARGKRVISVRAES
jgi:NADPH:quinone reductase-like Zn-dependent oxidoreductase